MWAGGVVWFSAPLIFYAVTRVLGIIYGEPVSVDPREVVLCESSGVCGSGEPIVWVRRAAAGRLCRVL